jgi:hypothetical protein
MAFTVFTDLGLMILEHPRNEVCKWEDEVDELDTLLA